VRGTTRAPRLLAAVIALGLLALAGLPAAAGRYATETHRTVIVAAVGDAVVVARTAPQRLTAVHRLTVDRLGTPSGTLPAAVLLAFLLALRVMRNRATGAAGQAIPRIAAGRGPPVTS
jgi:hypothetical protein